MSAIPSVDVVKSDQETPMAVRTGLKRPTWWMLNAGLVLVMLGSLALWSSYQFGSISNGIAYLSGHDLILDRHTIDFGVLPSGSHATAPITLHNFSGIKIRLIGARSSCSCTVVAGLPTMLGAWKSVKLDVGIHTTAPGKPIDESIQIFTDHPSIRFEQVRVLAAVDESP